MRMEEKKLGRRNREDTSPDRRRCTQIFPFRDSRLACYCDVTRKYVKFSSFLLHNFNSTVHTPGAIDFTILIYFRKTVSCVKI
jgi:hypothetical protein